MKPKTIHILGGGQWQVPSIRLAKSLGYRVLVTDMYPERPGYAHADVHEMVDITDRSATLEAARRHRIDGIVCDTTDVGVPTMAYVAEKLGLCGIGYETALNFTNKFRMRSMSSAAGLPNPPFRLVGHMAEATAAAGDIGYPVVVKPVDNQSSRGVHVVRVPAALPDAYCDACHCSRAGQVIVEGFLNGTEVTVESYCIDGQVFAVGISDKDHFRHRPEVANRLTYPADFPPAVMDRIREVNREVIRALGLRTGVTHAEYMVVDSEAFLVEIAARGAGSYVYTHIVPYLAGAPVPRMYLELAMGEATACAPAAGQRAANLAFFDFPSGTVRSIRGVEQARCLPGVQELLLEFAVGDTLRPPADDRSRPGLAVIFGQTRREVLETTDRVFRTVFVETA